MLRASGPYVESKSHNPIFPTYKMMLTGLDEKFNHMMNQIFLWSKVIFM